MSKIPTTDMMVSRRVRGGHTASESIQLLAQLIRQHRGENLATALVYNGYATEPQARRFAGVAR